MGSIIPQTSAEKELLVDQDAESIDTKDLINTLSDEYTIQIIEHLSDSPISCPEIAEKASISKPTVYRRINKLVDIGLVESQTQICGNGHHRSEYTIVECKLNIDIGGDIAITNLMECSDNTENSRSTINN
jgi:predicted transcriptional regulator